MYGNLKLQLWKCGLRQNQLAQLVDIDDTLLSKIVNGFRRPSPDLRVRIARVLECDEAWLFEESQKAQPPEAVRHLAAKTAV
jgi:transcriptional regulator with XRE-family HTH domain